MELTSFISVVQLINNVSLNFSLPPVRSRGRQVRSSRLALARYFSVRYHVCIVGNSPIVVVVVVGGSRNLRKLIVNLPIIIGRRIVLCCLSGSIQRG